MKNVMRIGLIALAMLLPATGHAQREVGQWTIMPKVGINLTKLTGGEVWFIDYGSSTKMSPSTKRGLALGVEAEYQLFNGVGVSAGIGYSQQGAVYEDIPNELRNQKIEVDYLTLPVMAHFYVARGLAVQAGLQAGLAVKHKESGEAHYAEGNTSGWRSYTSQAYRTFDYGVPLGLSYDLDNLRLELRYYQGLHDITKLDLKERNRVLQITVGYRFGL